MGYLIIEPLVVKLREPPGKMKVFSVKALFYVYHTKMRAQDYGELLFKCIS
jgi:hypothetical protein